MTIKQFFQFESPLGKVEPSYLLFNMYFILNIAVYSISVLFTMPLWDAKWELWFVGCTWIVATTFFLISVCRNPGKIYPNKDVEFLVSLPFYSI